MKRMQQQVLIVDDDPNYTHLIEEALKSCKSCPQIKVLHSGADLLTWLETSQRPSVIFLDINMPGTNGFEVLKVLKSADRYKTIPIIMLTVSENRDEVAKSYDIGANAYIIKPMTFTQLVSRMEVLSHYWFDIAQTPGFNWLRPNGYSTDN